MRCKDTEKKHSSEVYAHCQHCEEDVLLLHLHKAGQTKPPNKKNITDRYGKRQDSIRMHQLRIRLTEMDRQMSGVRRMEHIQGTTRGTFIGFYSNITVLHSNSFKTGIAEKH